MEIMRTMMDFEFDTKKVQNTHFHQDLEILYVLDGGLEIQIESEKYELGKGDFLLINANKRHSIRETEEELLTASFRINFSMLAEYLGTNQILFWCNTTADKNEAYEQLRKILDRVLNRFYDKEGEGAQGGKRRDVLGEYGQRYRHHGSADRKANPPARAHQDCEQGVFGHLEFHGLSLYLLKGKDAHCHLRTGVGGLR